MTTALWILLAFILILAVLLVISSPGKPRSFVDDKGRPLAGSISEKIFVEINGVKQGMFIKSKNDANPVLLYLHGGIPDYFLQDDYPTGLKDYFTIVWWEMRGSGISYNAGVPRAELNVELMIDDTLALTNYLRERFGREKIYLMGHSGGTFVAIQAAARAPELYYAYIGQAQMANQLKSELLAYEYMLAQFKANGNADMVRKMEAAPVTLEGGVPDAYRMLRDPAMHSLGVGTTHDMKSVVTGIILPSFQSRDYTLAEKINLWRGKAESGIAVLWNAMVTTDLSQQVTEFSIPVYFFSGIHDYTCAYEVSKEYFGKIHAPVKGFYTFDQSAHSPMFEEPEKMRQIFLEDVLRGKSDLAD